MPSKDKSRRNFTLLSVLVILTIGGIVTGVIIWQEGRKSNSHENDLPLSTTSTNNDVSGFQSSDDSTTISSDASGISISSDGVSATTSTLTNEFETTSTENADISLTSHTSSSNAPVKSATKTSATQATTTSTCGNPNIRSEWRDLSSKEQSDFLNAVNEMYKKPSKKGYENLQMDFVKSHIEHKSQIHNSTMFLLWHRHFIFEYEKELRAINPSVSLPYWDWGMDYENPSSSPLFVGDAFGGNGDSSTGCIKTGKFVGIQTQFHENQDSHHCVKRSFGGPGNVTVLSSPSLMMGYALLNGFKDFTRAFESYPHALAHNFIGGDMITNQSPSDPLFFLVHANADRYFFIWQENHPEGKYPENLEDKLPAYEVPLAAAFQHPLASDYCYSYSSISNKGMRKRDLKARIKRSKHKVLYPSRVPANFTSMMGGDPKIVEKLEDKSIQFIDCLNDQGFDSPASSYSSDRNWKKHQLQGGYSRFQKKSESRKYLENCMKYLEGAF